MAAPSLALKFVATPVLVGGASVAGRRMGPQVAGWLVALPLTSGPLAYFLALDHGAAFASGAAVGMLAGTISQALFASAYRVLAWRGIGVAAAAGVAAFAVTTLALSQLHLAAGPLFAVVIAVVALSSVLARRHVGPPPRMAGRAPRWDIPARMVTATAVVIAITALAPLLGPYLAGLLSPFPVFAGVHIVFTHQTEGDAAATSVIGGFLVGLASPAVFLLMIALLLQPLGLPAFALATAGALLMQAATTRVLPAGER